MIQFNNIPDTIRTPGALAEIDNSRALQGLIDNPHKVLIPGQMVSEGNAAKDTLYAISSENIADGYFGPGSILARMCRMFKANNPNTELYAIVLSDNAAGTTASARIHFSVALSHAGGSCSGGDQTIYMLGAGSKLYQVVTSGWSVQDLNSAYKTLINANSYLPFHASFVTSGPLILSAVNTGECGNNLDVRFNYYEGQSHPTFFGDSVTISAFAGGSNNPDIGDAWAIIDAEQFHHIINPYHDTANLDSVDDELDERFKPLADKGGHAYYGYQAALASISTHGNTRNNPHTTLIGMYDSPTPPEEWAAAWAAIASYNLNDDPARPLHYLKLNNVLPPPVSSRFTQSERNVLLYDGVATWIVDGSGNVLIERSITTYQTNALGIPDPSYLDIQTLFTLLEIRFQFKARMTTRFILPRFKLASNSYPVQAGSYVVTPNTIKGEIIALFTELKEEGLIDDIEQFIDNLIVEIDATDPNRVNVLLAPNLINQFRMLAGKIQFIL
jgi:phage tail sheath gpL-like